MVFVFFTLIFLVALYLFLIAPRKRRNTAPFDTTKFAHRGLHTEDGQVPENSLAAIRRAREAGYGVEWDVQFTADRQIVVFHDATLTRMCGVDKRVDSLTYEQLQAYTLLDSDQRIPLLSEALEALGDAPLICEFKSHGGATDVSLCEAAYPLLAAHKGPWCMESFNPFMVGWFMKHQPQVVRGILSKHYEPKDGQTPLLRWVLGAMLTNVLCRPDFLAFCHRDKRQLSFSLCRILFRPLCVAWTVRSEMQQQVAERVFDTVIFENYTPAP